MALNEKERKDEKNHLNDTLAEIEKQVSALGKEINVKQEEITEFKKILWEDKGSIDSVEMRTGLMASEMEANFMLMKMEKYKK